LLKAKYVGFHKLIICTHSRKVYYLAIDDLQVVQKTASYERIMFYELMRTVLRFEVKLEDRSSRMGRTATRSLMRAACGVRVNNTSDA